MKKARIGVIISTTRVGRFADKVANWFMPIADNNDNLQFELIDLRDYPMPIFNEPVPPAMSPSTNLEVQKWQQKISEFDGYIFILAEYNSSIPAVLKNALDSIYNEWGRKPAAFLSYGSLGGVRSVQHLRHIVTNLQMTPVSTGVNIPGGDFFAVLKGEKTLSELEYLVPSVKGMLEQLLWWTMALKQARESV